jgi:hypothetical protein
MLIELLISMVVLSVGLGGVLVLLITSIFANGKSSYDTTSTMLAEHVLEQISGQPANSAAPLTITDCGGTNWTINTLGAPVNGGSGGSYGGDGADVTANGIVDWTEDYSAIPAGYAMQYVSCGAGAKQVTYDVRWDVITMSTFSRMIFVSARPINSAQVGGMRFVIPVQLRTIGGM